MMRDGESHRTGPAERILRALAVRAAFAILLALFVEVAAHMPTLANLEQRVLDWRIGLWRQLSEADTSRIAIVAMDEESLSALHASWPPPRDVYARAIAMLRRSGAAVIGINEVLEGTSGDPRQDQALSRAIGNGADVVLASRLEADRDPPRVIQPPFNTLSGFCEVPLDSDGVARQFYILPVGFSSPPTCFALCLLRRLYRDAQFVPQGLVDEPGTTWPISWAGPPAHAFHVISLKRVLGGGDLSHDVRDRIVLLGSVLNIESDAIRTPFSRAPRTSPPAPPMSAVELTANVVFTLLNSNRLQRLSELENVTLTVLAVFFAFMLFGSLHPLFSFVCACFFISLYTIGAMYSLVEMQRELPLVVPVVGVAAAWLGALLYRLVR